MADALDALLNGTLAHPATGEAIRLPTQLILRPSLLGEEEELLRPWVLGRKVGMVCDQATYEALGKRIEPQLESLATDYTLIGLKQRPKANDATAARIEHAAKGCEVLLAVGSGTINDLTQYVSHRMQIPYICLPTAPSMNGYLSANASITVQGHKKSLPAPLPEALLVDLDVLARAPIRLIRAGLADSLCRTTVQSDWLLAHHLLGTAYMPALFDWTQDVEWQLRYDPTGLLEGNLDSMRALTEWLLLGGVAMTACGSSMPASQGEHMLAHVMDMALGDDAPDILHGEAIAVTSLSMAALQEQLLAAPPELAWKAPDKSALSALLGEHVATGCLSGYAAKHLTEPRIATLNEVIRERWQDITQDIHAIRIPYEELESLLAAVGAPLTPEAIGWPNDIYEKALTLASLTRERFTFLDVGYLR